MADSVEAELVWVRGWAPAPEAASWEESVWLGPGLWEQASATARVWATQDSPGVWPKFAEPQYRRTP